MAVDRDRQLTKIEELWLPGGLVLKDGGGGEGGVQVLCLSVGKGG